MNLDRILSIAAASLAVLSISYQYRFKPEQVQSKSSNSTLRGDGTQFVEATNLTNDGNATVTHRAAGAVTRTWDTNTPSASSGGVYTVGTTTDPSAANHVLGALFFTTLAQNGGGARIAAQSTEAWSGSARGTDLIVAIANTGAAGRTNRVAFRGNGNVVLNVSGSAVGTSATAGFCYLPSSAGVPTGSPSESPTGAVATIIDSTNSRLYARLGGAWRYLQFGATNGLNVLTKNADYTITASDVGPGGLLLVAGKASGTITITLPSVSAIPSGVPIVIKRSSVNSELATITVASTGAGEPIHRGSSATGTSFSLTANGQSETLYGNGSAIWYAES